MIKKEDIKVGLRFYITINDTATTEIYTYGHTLALHDALPISSGMESTIKLRIGDFLLTGVVFGNTAYKIGQEVKFEVGGEDILLFDRKSGKLITAGSLHA